MTKKNIKPEPANLTSAQKDELKRQIITQFPMLSLIADDIDFLIEEYNKDKKYITKLMRLADPVKAVNAVVDESKVDKMGDVIKVVKADTDEWKHIIDKIKQSKKDFVVVNPDNES